MRVRQSFYAGEAQSHAPQPDPHKGGALEDTVTKKVEAVALLKESFDLCDVYFSRLSRATMAEIVPPTSGRL